MYDLNVNTFNPDQQYRCDFIRGKSISNMEDYLSVYTSILNEICPIAASDFKDAFDRRFAQVFHIDPSDESAMKAVKNHRTENVTKILGLIYRYEDVVYLSRRTEKYLEDNDQPALFKSVCFQFQQPNGAQTVNAFNEKRGAQICIRPFHFIIKLLKIAHDNNRFLSKNDIYYYVLNCKQTLQGRVSPETVFEKIVYDRNHNITRTVREERNPAWTFQHMREQLDYLEFANLIRVSGSDVVINMREERAINYFIEELNHPLRFDCDSYDTRRDGFYRDVESDWLYYMGVSPDIDLSVFNTEANSMDVTSEQDQPQHVDGETTVELGDRGEAFIMNYERTIVRAFNERLVNRVIHLGRTRGLGYDITSIEANRAERPGDRELTRFIEVKTTFRTTAPNPDFQISIDLTRNEWVAACQQREHFYIYRLYFTNSGTFLFILKNPYQKNEDGTVYVTPTSYRIEYRLSVSDERETFLENESA